MAHERAVRRRMAWAIPTALVVAAALAYVFVGR